MDRAKDIKLDRNTDNHKERQAQQLNLPPTKEKRPKGYERTHRHMHQFAREFSVYILGTRQILCTNKNAKGNSNDENRPQNAHTVIVANDALYFWPLLYDHRCLVAQWI